MDVGMADRGAQRLVRLLVVEDDISLNGQLCEGLTYYGFAVVPAHNGSVALKILADQPDIALVLTDMDMPGMSGLELAIQVLAERRAAVVILTGRGMPRLEQDAEDAGVFTVLRKPVRLPALVETLRQAWAALDQVRAA